MIKDLKTNHNWSTCPLWRYHKTSTTTPAVSVDLKYTILLVAKIISWQFLYCPVTAFRVHGWFNYTSSWDCPLPVFWNILLRACTFKFELNNLLVAPLSRFVNARIQNQNLRVAILEIFLVQGVHMWSLIVDQVWQLYSSISPSF